MKYVLWRVGEGIGLRIRVELFCRVEGFYEVGDYEFIVIFICLVLWFFVI